MKKFRICFFWILYFPARMERRAFRRFAQIKNSTISPSSSIPLYEIQSQLNFVFAPEVTCMFTNRILTQELWRQYNASSLSTGKLHAITLPAPSLFLIRTTRPDIVLFAKKVDVS